MSCYSHLNIKYEHGEENRGPFITRMTGRPGESSSRTIFRWAIWKILRRLEEILLGRLWASKAYVHTSKYVFGTERLSVLRTPPFFYYSIGKSYFCIVYETLGLLLVQRYAAKSVTCPRSDFRSKSRATKLDDLLSLAHGNSICRTGATAVCSFSSACPRWRPMMTLIRKHGSQLHGDGTRTVADHALAAPTMHYSVYIRVVLTYLPLS